MPICHWQNWRAAHLLGSAACPVHPAACVRSTGELFTRLGGQPRPNVPRFQSTTSLADARSPCGQLPLGCRTESFVHASGHRAISPRFPVNARRSIRVSESHGLQASSGPGDSCCGPAVVRIHCVSRQQSLADADSISATPGQKCAFRPLGVRPGVHAAVLTCARPDGGGHVSRETECAAGGPCSSNRDAPLKDTAPHPAVRFY